MMIYSPKLNIPPTTLIWFAVDTGSPISFLSQADAKRLKIVTEGRKQKDVIQLGGSNFRLLETDEYHLIMLTEKSSFITTGNLDVAEVVGKTEEEIRRADGIPSIIGMDFLKKNNLSLHIYPAEELAFLEKE